MTRTIARYHAAAVAGVLMLLTVPGSVSVGVETHAGPFSHEKALEMMSLNQRIHVMEDAILAGDESYQVALAALKSAREELAAHRQAFESERNADAAYAKVKSDLEQASAKKAELDQAFSAASGARTSAANELQKARTAAAAASPDVTRLQRRVATIASNIEIMRRKSSDRLELEVQAQANRSGTNENAIDRLQRGLDEARQQLADAEARLGSAQSQVSEAQGRIEQAASQIESLRDPMNKARSELVLATSAFESLDRDWNNRYENSEKTRQLKLHLREAEQAQLQTRQHVLEAAAQRDPQYADLLAQRQALAR